jgi:predicted aldo/keto reductase-like oxidoreductase
MIERDRNMRRRVFIGSVFAGLSLTGSYARPPKPRAGDIPRRLFGRTGEELTVIGPGGARFNLLRTIDEAGKLVLQAYDQGINYFDCAHSYWEGHSEEVYGKVLPEFRKEIFITSKTTQRSAAEAEKELDLSLRRMKTDYLDLWQIHGVGTIAEVDAIFASGGAIEAIESARQKGKCRFIGFTGHSDPEVHLEMLRRYQGFDSILMPLNPADPSYLSFEKNVLPIAVERKMAIQAMKVFGNAFLLRSLNCKECLEYVLSLPIHCATLGFSTPGQLQDDVRIAQNFSPLNPEEMRKIQDLVPKGTGSLTGPALEYWKKN